MKNETTKPEHNTEQCGRVDPLVRRETTKYTLQTKFGFLVMTEVVVCVKDNISDDDVSQELESRSIEADDWLTEDMAKDFEKYINSMGAADAPEWIDARTPWVGIDI